jgi:hypothetical protein
VQERQRGARAVDPAFHGSRRARANDGGTLVLNSVDRDEKQCLTL